MSDSNSSFTLNDETEFDHQLTDISSGGEIIATGSTCICYRIRLYGKLHFMKQLKEELRYDPRYISILKKEFETGYRLDHPNIVRYIHLGQDYLLTEYIDGETLNDFTSSQREWLSQRGNSDKLLAQLLDAVEYLHSHQTIHLDLKPDNILITRIGHELKLIDLGYCHTDTYTDTTGRTNKYAAPEQFDTNYHPSPTADIYAIGRIMERLPLARKYRKVIERCTAQRPFMRYQSVEELRKALFTRDKTVWRWVIAAIMTVAAVICAIMLFPPRLETIPSDNRVTAQQDTASSTNDKENNNTSIPSEETYNDVPRDIDINPVTTGSPTSPTIPSTPSLSNTQNTPITQNSPSTPNTPITQNTPSSPNTQNTPTPARIDTMALRRSAQAVLRPIFRKHLGKYDTVAYDEMTQDEESKYTLASVSFENDAASHYMSYYNSNSGKYPKELIESEWCQTKMMLRLTQAWQMKRNSPGHDKYYDRKVFRYYEQECGN